MLWGRGEIIHPYPKAPLRKASRRGRELGKSTILTNTPEKTVIEHKNIDIIYIDIGIKSEEKHQRKIKFKKENQTTLVQIFQLRRHL